MRLTLLHVADERIGYGRYGACLQRELEYQGVQCDRLHDKANPDPTNVVCWISVPAHVFGAHVGQKMIISTMWEATTLPESFREGLDNFEKIIVPSDQNLELFSRYHPNVIKVPLGIDPVRWHYVERQDPERYFTYLHGGFGTRKGNDLVFQAFKKLWGKDGSWGSGPIPKVIFKSPRSLDFFGERIEKVCGWISEEQEQSLYAGAHCYLQPSRGEGFGLQPLQAIAQGIPTILTNAHGHTDFAHLGYGLSTTMVQSAGFLHGDAGPWWEPSLDELCQYMEYVYRNYDEAKSFAKMASDIALEQWTWKQTAEQFIDAIGRDELCAPYKGSGEWRNVTGRLYRVKTVKFHPCWIAGTHYQFLPGEEYDVPADVKRILFECGILHPDCVHSSTGDITEGEVGLTPDQVARVPQYSIERMHCQMCGQKLNENVWEPQFDEEGNLVG